MCGKVSGQGGSHVQLEGRMLMVAMAPCLFILSWNPQIRSRPCGVPCEVGSCRLRASCLLAGCQGRSPIEGVSGQKEWGVCSRFLHSCDSHPGATRSSRWAPGALSPPLVLPAGGLLLVPGCLTIPFGSLTPAVPPVSSPFHKGHTRVPLFPAGTLPGMPPGTGYHSSRSLSS